jgi:uncharacterized protein YndB with AHSA1/START domain
MTILHHEVKINAAPEKVWNALADLEAVQNCNPLVAQTRYTSENREGVGASRHCDFKPKAGKSLEKEKEEIEGARTLLSAIRAWIQGVKTLRRFSE